MSQPKLNSLLGYLDGLIADTKRDIEFRRKVITSERYQAKADALEFALSEYEFIREQLANIKGDK